MQKFDLLIVGAGMVGLTLALAIRKQSNLTVALVDKTPLVPLTDTPELRVSAINAVSQQLLANLDVWPLITARRYQAYQQMHIWQKAGGEALDFSVDDLCQTTAQATANDQLGWIIENNVIRSALWQQCQQDQGIHFLTSSDITDISIGDSEVFVSFAEQPPAIVKLVVGADGANSWLRQKMNFTMAFKDYDHHAIVATVKSSQGHQHTAWQVFLDQGPLAFLPISTTQDDGQLCSIVWSTSPEEAERLAKLSPEHFAKEITAASDGKLGHLELVSERVSYPLTMRLCQQFFQQRVALVGDAAHTIHPLAGQGVNLGLLDAAALAQTITKDMANDLNNELLTPASFYAQPQQLTTALNQWARWRKSEAFDMISAMAAIKQLFSYQNPISQAVRGFGMALLNKTPVAKALLINKALGYKGQLPELAKPTITRLD